jgi:hypothetical protein
MKIHHVVWSEGDGDKSEETYRKEHGPDTYVIRAYLLSDERKYAKSFE